MQSRGLGLCLRGGPCNQGMGFVFERGAMQSRGERTSITRYHCLLSQHVFLCTFSIDISPALLSALNCF